MSQESLPELSVYDYYEQGMFLCANCSQPCSVDGLAPLLVVRCPACDGENLVPLRLAGFWLYEAIAMGGMGEVYKALHPDHPEKFFAVKLLPRLRRDDLGLIRNLEVEIRVNKEVGGHVCMINLVDSGFENGEHFMVTEFVDGKTLHYWIQELGSIPETEMLMIALRLLSAETHIYGRGYLYRDLKPENVIISPAFGAFLCDFGICLPIDEAIGMDEGDTLQGSVLYIPPERLLAQGEDAGSEIYSLGLLLYHALVGKPYFEASEIKAVARMHVDALTREQQAERMMDVEPDVAGVLQRMIHRQPSERYQTFFEAERDLFRILVKRLYGLEG